MIRFVDRMVRTPKLPLTESPFGDNISQIIVFSIIIIRPFLNMIKDFDIEELVNG